MKNVIATTLIHFVALCENSALPTYILTCTYILYTTNGLQIEGTKFAEMIVRLDLKTHAFSEQCLLDPEWAAVVYWCKQ